MLWRGLCQVHYNRWKSDHGEGAEWLDQFVAPAQSPGRPGTLLISCHCDDPDPRPGVWGGDCRRCQRLIITPQLLERHRKDPAL